MTDTPTSEQERREAKVVSRHLPSGYSAEPNVLSDGHGNAAASAFDLMQPGQESSLKLLGGDIHRDLYKINARAKLHQRAATFLHLSPHTSEVATPGSDGEMAAAEQRAPGGFRRQYLLRQQGRFNRVTTLVTRSLYRFWNSTEALLGRTWQNQRMRQRSSRTKMMRSHGPWMNQTRPGHF
jgi:solute carrier family 36 (proton-coupled amino acid transporter)